MVVSQKNCTTFVHDKNGVCPRNSNHNDERPGTKKLEGMLKGKAYLQLRGEDCREI